MSPKHSQTDSHREKHILKSRILVISSLVSRLSSRKNLVSFFASVGANLVLSHELPFLGLLNIPKLLAGPVSAGLPAPPDGAPPAVFFGSDAMAGFRLLNTPTLLAAAEAGFPADGSAFGFDCWYGGTWLPLSFPLGSCCGGLLPWLNLGGGGPGCCRGGLWLSWDRRYLSSLFSFLLRSCCGGLPWLNLGGGGLGCSKGGL